ncbi:MAG: 3-hydroxyacyl-CoA dehydrogenase [Actinomycetota bacterium]|nr:3-hydroxyacyl-CoA dehydrogenase [Actinomycetota bacterium]
MGIENVFMVGAGFMGGGIAQVAATAGYRVKMCDVSEERLDTGLKEIEWSLGKLLSKRRITREQYDGASRNLETTTAMGDAGDADLVVEAVPESLELKSEVFAALDAACPEHTILATNTSAIPISSIAAATGRPDRVVGTHFFGPVPLMRLCEIIRGLITSEETFYAADGWARSVGKETVLVRRDHAGFVANRVNIPATLEAVRMVEEGFACPEDIDRASGGNDAGVGPMQIMDNAGIDVTFGAAKAIYDDTGDPVFLPPPLMRRMVAAGLLGRKTGRGFYDYPGGRRESREPPGASAGGPGRELEDERRAVIARRLFLPNLLEAVRLLEAGVAAPADIDKACRLGFNFPLGPLEIADGMGLDVAMEAAEGLYRETASPVYAVPPLLRRMVAAGLRFQTTNKMGSHL